MGETAAGRLLVAEDNPVNQEAIRRILERRGYAVTLAGDGREVVERALGAGPGGFDVIFMDVQMPELDGFEATARIRSAAGFEGVPIVAMTAHAMAGDKERCLAGGMTDYISKPIQRQALFAMLERILGVRAGGPGGAAAGGGGSAGDAGTRPGSAVGAASRVEVGAVPEAPALDAEALMDNIGGDTGMLDDLLGVLEKTRAGSLEAIRRAIAAGDGPGLDRAAHKLAGTLGTFFALGAFEAAKRLENLGREGRMEETPWAYFELERRLGAFDDAIRVLRAGRG